MFVIYTKLSETLSMLENLWKKRTDPTFFIDFNCSFIVQKLQTIPLTNSSNHLID